MATTAPRLPGARTRAEPLVDAAVASAVLAVSIAVLYHGGIAPSRPGRQELDLVGVALAAGSAVPLVAWRLAPLGTFAITAAAGAALGGLGYPLDLMLGPAAALYLLAASREPAAPWTARTTATVLGMLAAYLGATAAAHATVPVVELLHNGLAWGAAWFAGERTRLQRDQVAELRERARFAERDRERERLLAATEERARIARDLHDSAGHAVNVIAVRAGAARLRHHQDPDRSLRALEAIEEVARQTVEEIDGIVSALRERDPAGPGRTVQDPAGLASIGALIARRAGAGLEVASEIQDPPRPLSPAADQAAYRILQEALTNAARHGAGSARIELAFDDDAVELTITNPVPDLTAPEPAPKPAPAGGGHGLIGMRERATLLGGSLHAGRSGTEFVVRARIPWRGDPT
jgi:signal transduction histidine kinase